MSTLPLLSQNYKDIMLQTKLPYQGRDWNAGANAGMVFILPILALHAWHYVLYTALCTMACSLPKALQIIMGLVLFMYNMLFWNMFISYWQCVRTDPGRVPQHWGFRIEQSELRRRYCKMCSVWKPERCHHCSICNRCHLNMDHHSPWVNNCIGFYNRKFFIQTLLYTFFCLLYMAFTTPIIGLLVVIGGGNVLFCIMYMLLLTPGVLLLICTLFNFVRFHLKLVLENYTTIENLERVGGERSEFDLGRRRNWEQVFGVRDLLWMLPFHLQTSRPIGDGACWLLPSGEIRGAAQPELSDEYGQETCCRILVVGDAMTGKSHLVSRFLYGTLPERPEATIGAEFGVQAVNLDTGSVQLHLWEMCGQDRYQLIKPAGGIRFDGVIIVYDITDASSFENSRKWFSYAYELSKPSGVFMLLGNKLDLVEKDLSNRKVKADEGEHVANRKGILFAEMSAVTSSNTNAVLKRLLGSTKVPSSSLIN